MGLTMTPGFQPTGNAAKKAKGGKLAGVWRTTNDGSKVYFGPDGKVRGGGPTGPVLGGKKSQGGKKEAAGLSFGEVAETNTPRNMKSIPKLATRKEVKSKFGKHEKEYGARLTSGEKDALMRYSEENTVNEFHRRPNDFSEKDQKFWTERSKVLDTAVAKGKAPKDMVLERYITVPEGASVKELQGKTISDSGYMSTTLEMGAYKDMMRLSIEDGKLNYGEPKDVVRFEIKAKKGATMGFVEGIGEGKAFSTSEVLLPRNAKINVTSVREVVNTASKVGPDIRTWTVEATYE